MPGTNLDIESTYPSVAVANQLIYRFASQWEHSNKLCLDEEGALAIVRHLLPQDRAVAYWCGGRSSFDISRLTGQTPTNVHESIRRIKLLMENFARYKCGRLPFFGLNSAVAMRLEWAGVRSLSDLRRYFAADPAQVPPPLSLTHDIGQARFNNIQAWLARCNEPPITEIHPAMAKHHNLQLAIIVQVA